MGRRKIAIQPITVRTHLFDILPLYFSFLFFALAAFFVPPCIALVVVAAV